MTERRYWTIQDVLHHPYFAGMQPEERRDLIPENPPKRGENRFLRMGFDGAHSGDLNWLNRPEEAFKWDPITKLDFNRFADLPAPPKIGLIGKRPRKRFRDFEQWSYFWLVSQRGLDLLLEMDAEAVDYVEAEFVETKFGKQEAPGKFYCVILRRLVDAIDWERSNIVMRASKRHEWEKLTEEQPFEYRMSAHGTVYIAFRADIPANIHLLRDDYFPSTAFASVDFKAEVERRKITGPFFEDLAR